MSAAPVCALLCLKLQGMVNMHYRDFKSSENFHRDNLAFGIFADFPDRHSQDSEELPKIHSEEHSMFLPNDWGSFGNTQCTAPQ